jgi:isopenicillin-N N-acyltransferase-like protein
VNRFPVVEASGSAYDMGYAHGAQAADLVERYLRLIEKSTGRDRAQLAEGALTYVPRIEALSPAYLEETRGLADGAGLSFDEAMICQVRGAATQAIGAQAIEDGVDGCTAFALTGDATAGGRTFAGQNQDLGPEFADVGIVLRLAPTDGRPRLVIFTFAGQLGYMGMNEHGLGHFANGLGNAPWQPGLPHYPLKRRCFEMERVDQCVEVLRAHNACSAGNMVFCDGDGRIGDVEIRPEGIALFDDDDADRRLHTNHYLSAEFCPFEDGNTPDSCPRLDRLRQLVLGDWGSITLDDLKGYLADHEGDPGAICRHGARGSYSVCGYIADPGAGVLHVRRGLGCTGTWTEIPV